MKKSFLLLISVFFIISANAADWTKVALSASPVKDFAFLKIDEKTCYAFGLEQKSPNNYYPKIFKTTDGGAKWDTISKTGLKLGTDVKEAFINGSIMYVLSSEGLYKSADNGANWSIAAADYAGIYAPTDVSLDGTNIYISTSKGLFVTSDDFKTLKNINYNVKLGTINYAFASAEKLNGTLFGGINSKTYFLTDTTWTQCTGLPDRASNFNMFAYENGTYYLSDRANTGYTLYTSTDGKAWTKMEESAFSDVAYVGKELWATKVSSGVYRRTIVSIKNKTFTDLNSDIPIFPVVNGMVVLGQSLFVGLYGNTEAEAGLYVRAVSVTSEVKPSGIKAVINYKVEIWPNPTSEVLNISMPEQYSSYIITNITGHVVLCGNINGTKINMEHVKNGIYNLSLKGLNGNTSSIMFIKK